MIVAPSERHFCTRVLSHALNISTTISLLSQCTEPDNCGANLGLVSVWRENSSLHAEWNTCCESKDRVCWEKTWPSFSPAAIVGSLLLSTGYRLQSSTVRGEGLISETRQVFVKLNRFKGCLGPWLIEARRISEFSSLEDTAHYVNARKVFSQFFHNLLEIFGLNYN